jgi:hypothetical protein
MAKGWCQFDALLIKRGDTWEPKTEIIGPGYRAAYGLVALVHHQIEGVDETGLSRLLHRYSESSRRPCGGTSAGVAAHGSPIQT